MYKYSKLTTLPYYCYPAGNAEHKIHSNTHRKNGKDEPHYNSPFTYIRVIIFTSILKRFHNTKKNFQKKTFKSIERTSGRVAKKKPQSEHRFAFHNNISNVYSKLKTKLKYPGHSLVLSRMLEFTTILLRQYDNNSKS